MDAAVLKEIEQLRSLPVSGLREKSREVFGEDYYSYRASERASTP
jgi:hypothetical protein